MSKEPAEVRWYADGTANVTAYAEISQARGKACGAAARRSPRRSLHVPWIVRLSVNRVIALPVCKRHRDVCRAQQHRAGVRKQTVHHFRVLWRFGITQRRQAPRAWMTRHSKAFLHRDGNTMEHPACLALRQRCIGFFCLRPRIFPQLISEDVELRIVMINARKHAFRKFDGRDFLRANSFRRLQGGCRVERMWRARGGYAVRLILRCGWRRVLPGSVMLRGGGCAKHFRSGQGGCRKSQRHGSKEVASIHLRNGKGSAKNAQPGDRAVAGALEHLTRLFMQFHGSSRERGKEAPYRDLYFSYLPYFYPCRTPKRLRLAIARIARP